MSRIATGGRRDTYCTVPALAALGLANRDRQTRRGECADAEVDHAAFIHGVCADEHMQASVTIGSRSAADLIVQLTTSVRTSARS